LELVQEGAMTTNRAPHFLYNPYTDDQ